MRTTTITIDPKALNHNISQVAKLSQKAYAQNLEKKSQFQKKPANIMVMLKANAYGHELDLCTLALLESSDVQAIGVATMEEALQVKMLGWKKTIVLIEGVFSEVEWQTAKRYEMQCVIHQQRQLDWALQSVPSDNSPTCTVWLKYNTGMNRLGFSSEEIMSMGKQLDKAGYQQILISHFANADDKTHPLNAMQGQRFKEKLIKLQQVIPTIKGSLCNSAGIINFPEWHYDWVRAGIMIYGASPVLGTSAKELGLQAVMTVSARLMAIQDVPVGELVGYGSRWVAERPSRIGIVSVGYGDGYPRVVDETAFVVVVAQDGQSYTCPIIGRVAMDMLVIDLNHVADGDSNSENKMNVSIDDEVILWGSRNPDRNCPHIDQIAKSANTISYELLCRLTTRPKRQVSGQVKR